MGEALDALLTCPSRPSALVHGEGGSGGGAGAAPPTGCCDAGRYFAAIGRGGRRRAARPAQECADLMRVTRRTCSPSAPRRGCADPGTAWHLVGRRWPAQRLPAAGAVVAPLPGFVIASSCDIGLCAARAELRRDRRTTSP
jgi:hypothetical protein